MNATPTHFIDPPGLLLFAFDGTGNQDYGSGTSLSNVVKFRDAYRADPNEPAYPNTKWTGQKTKFGEFAKNNAFYISGPGTTDRYTKLAGYVKDAGTGESMTTRVDIMISYLHDYLSKVSGEFKGKNKSAKINLDIVGFSRGAAEARMFASKVRRLMYDSGGSYKLYKNGGPRAQGLVTSDQTWIYNKSWLQTNCNVNFNLNFLGLWNTVPAYGINTVNDGTELKNKGYSLEVDREWKRVVHAVAVNEHRAGFHVRSIHNSSGSTSASNRIDKGFLGAHSDIGGGYAEGDLSDVALMWVINEARNAGIDFVERNKDGTIKLNSRGDPVSSIPYDYRRVTNPIVHDSVNDIPGEAFNPSRDFLWANATSGSSQFETKLHLKLNWQDTLRFQAEGERKFQDVKKYSTGKFTSSKSKAYDKLKLEDNATVLYSNSSKQKLLVSNYVNWLKDKGYAIGSSTNLLD